MFLTTRCCFFFYRTLGGMKGENSYSQPGKLCVGCCGVEALAGQETPSECPQSLWKILSKKNKRTA